MFLALRRHTKVWAYDQNERRFESLVDLLLKALAGGGGPPGHCGAQ
jgi:hypothetical protein